MKHVLILFVVFVLSGCANGQGISLMPFEQPGANPGNFKLCHGFGCSFTTSVALSQKQWAYVLAPLKKSAKNAETERKNIAKTIARMEKAVTEAADITPDLGEAETFEKDQHQMDCLDETINTSRYLEFIEGEGLLKFHEVADPIHRGYFVDGMWPHNSATVRDLETGEIFAIDSYYFDNGVEPSIVPFKVWMAEWRPEELEASPSP